MSQGPQAVRFGTHDVAIGLSWRLLTKSERNAKSLRRMSDEENAKYGVIIAGTENDSVGFSQERINAPSAAHWLYEAADGAAVAVVEPLESSLFWFCAVSSDGPIPDLADLVCTVDQLEENLSTLEHRWHGLSYRLYAPDGMFPARSPENKSFAAVVEGVKAPKRVSLLQPSPLPMAAAAATVLAIAGASYYWWTNEQAASITKKRVAAQAQSAMALMNKKQELRSAADAKLKARLEAITKQLSAPSPAEQVAAWMLVAGKLPLKDGGWEILAVDCTQATCESKWIRKEGLGTTGNFLRLSSAVRVEQYNANNAVGAFRHQIAEGAPLVRPLDALPEWDAFGASFMTLMQRYEAVGIKGQVAAAAPAETIVIDPEGKGPENVLTVPVRFGTWSVQGQLLGDIEDFVSKLPSQNVVVTQLGISLTGDTTTWKLEGTYALK